MQSKQRPIIYCFRNDLRISDNAGFHKACNSGLPVLAVYVFDDTAAATWKLGGASRWWLHHSLLSLQHNLKRLGGCLILRSGSWGEQILHLVTEVNASAVYWQRSYEPQWAEAETELHQALHAIGVESKRFRGYLLFEPEQLRTQSNQPFKVYTPFWKACLKQAAIQNPLDAPTNINYLKINLPSDSVDDWRLLPSGPDWANNFTALWTPGEAGAWRKLESFFSQALSDYKENRDFPGLKGTSRLSPHLHFGEISPKQIWHRVHTAMLFESNKNLGGEAFLRELGWREFCYHLLFHWPTLPDLPFKPLFSTFPWREDEQLLTAWQQGKTGFPIVDAGMRELWSTGWMHNRVRMLAASLLVKNLLQPWQAGASWFWDTLLDADLANNAAGWQWVAGCGADAAPYFRIFNPVSQARKFDPEGEYIKKWLPELSALTKQAIHAPWEVASAELKYAGVQLGKNYPAPIVDLMQTRKYALEAYQKIKT